MNATDSATVQNLMERYARLILQRTELMVAPDHQTSREAVRHALELSADIARLGKLPPGSPLHQIQQGLLDSFDLAPLRPQEIPAETKWVEIRTFVGDMRAITAPERVAVATERVVLAVQRGDLSREKVQSAQAFLIMPIGAGHDQWDALREVLHVAGLDEGQRMTASDFKAIMENALDACPG